MSVFVVGSVNADVTLPVDELPLPGATVAAGEPIRTGGGKGANVAVAAARAGAAVRLVASVGDDEDGKAARAELEREGVEIAGVAVDAERSTGLAMICVDAQGENIVVISAGANAGLGPAAVSAGLSTLGASDICVVNFEIPGEAVRSAAKLAKARGARLVLNPSPVRPLGELLAARPTLVANQGEFEQLTAGGGKDLLARGCEAVVTTLGAEGARVDTIDASEAVSAFPAAAVDTTGAGDAFTGAFAAALAEGADLLGAATRGSAAGSLATTAVGARAAMPPRAAIDQLARG